MNEELFSSEPAPVADDLFSDEPAPNPRSVMGAVENLGHDIYNTGKGLVTAASQAVPFAMKAPLHAAESGIDMVQGKNFTETPSYEDLKTMGKTGLNLGKGLVEEGKRIGIGELLTGHPINAVEKFGGALYDKPLTTALDVAPIVGAAGKAIGIGGKIAETGSLLDDAARIGAESADDVARASTGLPGALDDVGRVAAEAPKPMGMPDEAAQILKETPQAPPPPPTGAPGATQAAESVPTGSTFQETVANLKNSLPGAVKKPLDEVGDFLTNKYGQAAKQPGWAETMGDVMSRKAQSMRFQEMGASPGQIRKLISTMGEDNVRALSDLAEARGVTEPIVGYQIGKRIDGLAESAGRTIGGIREIAAKRGATHNMKALVKEIRSELDSTYLKGGLESSEKTAYTKALEEIAKTPPTPDALAKTITKINKYASENKMVQKQGAFTKVANTASRINNRLIEKYLSPKELEAYVAARKDFGASEIFKRFYSFRAGRELAGRAGVGGLWRNLKQGAMDVGGHKVMEKFFDKMGNALKTKAGVADSLGSLSEEAMSNILSALDEAIDEVAVKR